MSDREGESGIPDSSISGSSIPLSDIRYRPPLRSSSKSSNSTASTGYGSRSDTERNSEGSNEAQNPVYNGSLSIPIKKLKYPLASLRGARVGPNQAVPSPLKRTISDREPKSDESIIETGESSDKKGSV